ncbi:hypothetical protein N7540_011419 [Penicillium herquei]|nr:hypothetical protein N7540_011419 [Penicillium herquei]
MATKGKGISIRQSDERDKKIEQEIDNWKRWIRSNEATNEDVTLPLERQRGVLIQTWQDFQSHFKDASAPQYLNVIPKIEDLQAAVSEAQNQWNQKHEKGVGKAKTRLFDFLDFMNDHSYFFEFVPTSDKYVSLITGVLSSVVKASVNYQEIADNLSAGLGTIHKYLRTARQKVELWPNTRYIEYLTVKLYVQVFIFLCRAMSWFSSHWRRLKTSLDKNYYKKEIQPTVEKIQEIVESIQHESVHHTETTTLDSNFRLRIMEKNIEKVQDKLDTTLEQMGDKSRNHSPEELQVIAGIICGKLLKEFEVQFWRSVAGKPIQKLRQSSAAHYTKEERDSLEQTSSQNECIKLCSREAIQSFIEPLIPYIEDGREEISRRLGGMNGQSLPGEVIVSMKKWLQDSSSRMIWIEGFSPDFYGSNLSLAALRLCAICNSTEMPSISVFCKKSNKFQKSRSASAQKEASLVVLLYSIISQLACLIPPEFEAVKELDEWHFNQLDGTLESAKLALDLIEAMVSLQLPSIIWIIDGLQLAEDRKTRSYLKSLVTILRSHQGGKVCFTTNGSSRALKTIEKCERVDASRMLQGRGGRVLKGGLPIDGLTGRFR